MLMKTKTPKAKKTKQLDSAEMVGVLAGMLLFVIRGLRDRSISAKPIMNIEPGAKEYGMTSLEEEIWEALIKCGIREKKQ